VAKNPAAEDAVRKNAQAETNGTGSRMRCLRMSGNPTGEVKQGFFKRPRERGWPVCFRGKSFLCGIPTEKRAAGIW